MKTLPIFIQTYRSVYPKIPILLLSKYPYATEAVNRKLYWDRLERLNFQKRLINKMRKKGDQNLYFYEGTELLDKHMDECTVDGVHPNDLGFMTIADNLTPVLRKVLTNL